MGVGVEGLTIIDADLASYANQLCQNRMAAYQDAPHDAEEHANIELSVLAGGYAYRQVAELIQNAADAVVEESGTGPGRIEIVADSLGLWAANTGAPVDRAGVKALLNSNASGKRAGQIGRFGLGFKSLLKLGGRIAVISRSVGLLFDPESCRTRIREALGLDRDAPAPGLRLAQPCSWDEAIRATPGADRFIWATTVVHAGLVADGAANAIIDEMRRFPPEFLLFLPGDVELVLSAEGVDRRLRRRTDIDGTVIVEDMAAEARTPQRWKVFETSVRVTDPVALADATAVHAREAVPLIWAVPVGAGREAAGRFFAFFPTVTETRTLGILNAPWKLNSDRTAVIPGAWNTALMEAAAEFIVRCLPMLARDDDPGAMLDAYPRDLGNQAEPAAPLVAALWTRLQSSACLPNCDGDLVPAVTLARPPLDAAEIGTAWSRLADTTACAGHLHPSCASTPARAGRLNQLAERLAANKDNTAPCLRRTPPITWLEMTGTADPDAVLEILGLADAFANTVAGYVWDSIRDRVRILLGEDGALLAAPEATLDSPPEAPLKSLHPAVVSDTVARRILQDRFRLQDGEGTDWGRLLDLQSRAADETGDWSPVWSLLRRMPWEDILEELSCRRIRVRSLAG